MQRQRHLVLKDAGLIGARPPETGPARAAEGIETVAPARAAEASKRIAIPVWSRHCIKLERYPKIAIPPDSPYYAFRSNAQMLGAFIKQHSNRLS